VWNRSPPLDEVAAAVAVVAALRSTSTRARRLVVRGFFAGLVQQIGVDDIEERLLVKIDEELEASV